MTAVEFQAMADDLRARARTLRSLGLHASAAVLELRASRHEFRAEVTRAEEAEAACLQGRSRRAGEGAGLGLSQFSQVTRGA